MVSRMCSMLSVIIRRPAMAKVNCASPRLIPVLGIVSVARSLERGLKSKSDSPSVLSLTSCSKLPSSLVEPFDSEV